MQLLHETGMLFNSRNTKGLSLGANSVDKIVIRYARRADSSLDIRRVAEGDSFIDALQRNSEGKETTDEI